MALFVLDTMAHLPGLTGLFLAGVCSSALCSVSAALNSLAAVTLEDYITVIFYIYLFFFIRRHGPSHKVYRQFISPGDERWSIGDRVSRKGIKTKTHSAIKCIKFDTITLYMYIYISTLNRGPKYFCDFGHKKYHIYYIACT
jgi:hypothetical protein